MIVLAYLGLILFLMALSSVILVILLLAPLELSRWPSLFVEENPLKAVCSLLVTS